MSKVYSNEQVRTDFKNLITECEDLKSSFPDALVSYRFERGKREFLLNAMAGARRGEMSERELLQLSKDIKQYTLDAQDSVKKQPIIKVAPASVVEPPQALDAEKTTPNDKLLTELKIANAFIPDQLKKRAKWIALIKHNDKQYYYDANYSATNSLPVKLESFSKPNGMNFNDAIKFAMDNSCDGLACICDREKTIGIEIQDVQRNGQLTKPAENALKYSIGMYLEYDYAKNSIYALSLLARPEKGISIFQSGQETLEASKMAMPTIIPLTSKRLSSVSEFRAIQPKQLYKMLNIATAEKETKKPLIMAKPSAAVLSK
jgi:hypothetical protein